jgi:hypothetical protein
VFKERVYHWAEKLGARVTSISLRPMTTKWASYSTRGGLTFGTSLLELPDELQDYVIAHELLHFHAPNLDGYGRVLCERTSVSTSSSRAELRRIAQDKLSRK